MKKSLKRIMAAAITVSLLPVIPFFSTSAAVEKVMIEDYKNYKQNFTYVDIKSVVNRGFNDDAAADGVGGWADQGPLNDMSCYKDRGITDYLGVKFDIIEPNSNNGKSAIVLRGQNDTSVPLEAEIAVDEKCAGVYFFHASPWLDGREAVGSYTFVYEDGEKHEVPVNGGVEVFNWWGQSDSESAIIGWVGNNDSSEVSMAIFAIANPYPEKKIAKIIAKTIGEGPYLCIAGITLTDAGPYLPQKEKVDIGNPDTSNWYPYTPCEDANVIAGSPIDMSKYLDAPAGKHGYINAVGDDLFFDDGTEHNVWGINFAYWSWTPEYNEAEQAAKRVAQLGFNTVRFHIPQLGSDTVAGVDNVSSVMRRTGYVSKKYMDRFCYLLYCLKKEGIYFGMDLSNTHGIWKDNNWQDEEKLMAATRGPNYFDEEIIKLYDKIAENILTYENPYTGMTIGEDPALLWCSLYNESSIMMTNNFEEWDYYYPKMNKLYNDWLLEKYPTRAALETAWADPSSENMGLMPEEDHTKGTVKLYASAKRKKVNEKRFVDNIAFLADMQQVNFNTRFATLRQWAPRAMLQGSTMFTSGVDDRSNVYSNIIENDFHSSQNYFYLLTGNGEHLQTGTKVSGGTPSPATKDKNLHNFKYFVAADVYGKPFMQTEWDAGLPNPYRNEFNLMMGAFTCFHNWGPVHFVWDRNCEYNDRSTRSDKDKFPASQHTFTDSPEKVHSFPTIAQMILRGDVTKAEKGFYPQRYRGTEVYERANQLMQIDPTYAWCGQSGAIYDSLAYDEYINDNDVAKLKKHGDKTGRYIAYTDEIMLDTNEGLFLVNTENTQAATGFVDRVELNDVIFEVENNYSAVYLTSLSKTDNIHDADNLLMTLAGDARPSGMVMNETCTEFMSNCYGPMIIEPILGTFTIKSQNTYKVYPIGFDGQRKDPISTYKTPEGYTSFKTSSKDMVMNYELVCVEKAENNPENEKISFIKEVDLGDLFTDLGEYEPFKNQIERIYLQDYIMAVAPGRFAPTQPVTRGQAIQAIVDIFGLTGEAAVTFADVKDGDTYYKAVMAAYKNGVVSGGTNADIRPDEDITRQDFFVMLSRALNNSNKKRTEALGKIPAYNDADAISAYAKVAVEELISLGYTEDRISFSPKAPLNRGDLCIALYNVLWK